MLRLYVLLIILPLLPLFITCDIKQPSVFISILIRNKAHILPYFLTCLENQSYPKSRIILYLKSDHNQDNTLDVLQLWLEEIVPQRLYHDIIKDFQPCDGEEGCLLDGEATPVGWTEAKFHHIMQLRQKSLDLARFSLADFYFSLDSDVLLTDPEALQHLVDTVQDRNMLVVSPLLTSIGLYSNFWAGMSETYYYLRTDEYKKILQRKQVGCYEVPMIHSAVLVNLRHTESDLLTYLPDNIDNYPGPRDDIIVFALSARLRDIPLMVCNDHYYGTVSLPLEDGQTLDHDRNILLATLLEVTARSLPVVADTLFKDHLLKTPRLTRLGVDKVYMVNLDRRKDRFDRMKYNFNMLGIDFQHVSAVDGRSLDQSFIDHNNIKMMPEFSEPYHGRPLTFGEIGCFMSHFNIWKEIVKSGHDIVIVFEDDIRFEPFFREKFEYLLEELKTIRDKWDLVYIGRKILHNSEEDWIAGSDQLVHVDYTYWTLAYIISKEGAQKLLDADPLTKMLPVDEFLPIMFDRHPNTTWSEQFPTRNLKALSVHPLLVHPTHYTGESGYISDTEDTVTIDIGDQGRGTQQEKEEL